MAAAQAIENEVMGEYLRRPYARMVIPEQDGTYVAEILEFPGCIAEGQTAEEAMTSLEEAAAGWISAALGQGQDIPEPTSSRGFSGKLALRIPKGLHRRITMFAERDGTSLNQFVITALAKEVGELSAIEGFKWTRLAVGPAEMQPLAITVGPAYPHVAVNMGRTGGTYTFGVTGQILHVSGPSLIGVSSEKEKIGWPKSLQ
ncbi:MAG: type II toxin-antitoxin system HicB family antitoxin [Candidatus Lambdaproteobacteria bacterium]|nr:type II toxin-antitoxin system HicB family antitoxin [Candidatus Lambdaproteobacteria bacterium]